MSLAAQPRPFHNVENSAQIEIAPEPVHGGALAPLREPLFRSLWIAAVISYTGSWMQNIATGWLMTSLTSSPMWVSLVQVALSLPVLIIALPAGALADLVDRRKFLLITQSSMVAASMALGILTITGTCTPTLLLILTFLLGAGAVMNDPAWQALTPDLVPVSKLAAAVALNSAGFNIARAVGPALGGLVVATAGSGAAFLLNAISFFGVILFLYRWKPAPKETSLLKQTVTGAIGIGLRYTREEPRIKAVLVRTFAFSICSSAFWALLPLIASRFGAEGYGAMLALFGLGALVGALLLARARRSFSYDAVTASATVVFAVALFGLVHTDGLIASSVFAAAAGLAWISMLATLNLVAQIVCPGWIRARVISMYVLVLQGGLAVGSVLWGAVATHTSIRFTFTVAAALLVAGLGATPVFRLQSSRNH
ncbi:MAG TPA: MFS transporter [Candidatus Limnocylindrales bacterium]|jgi:MFS family permease|nr:MFS transporter [Candidatus Limnocylindrales bacterium]